MDSETLAGKIEYCGMVISGESQNTITFRCDLACQFKSAQITVGPTYQALSRDQQKIDQPCPDGREKRCAAQVQTTPIEENTSIVKIVFDCKKGCGITKEMTIYKRLAGLAVGRIRKDCPRKKLEK